ncbi:MAG TPA: heme-binding domain-containing protein [Candidatus Limnocylindrales bacterium]|nr:heme-binding domain-containing protein [Candidatus Limnocylindrales bacterium]
MKRIALWVFAVLVIGFVAIQFVPYGRDHSNPPVTAEPVWDTAATRELAVRACFDCHSNETAWPWYTNIAPISWRIQQHVDEGREKLNFSEWGTGEQETDEIGEVVRDGEMPPWDYLLAHPEARLTDAETQVLVDGLTQTVGSGDGGKGEDQDD